MELHSTNFGIDSEHDECSRIICIENHFHQNKKEVTQETHNGTKVI
jgi:hypothetical protein